MRRRRRRGRANVSLHGTRVTFRFRSRDAAWSFMRAADDAGFAAGFPSLRAPYTVQTIAGGRDTDLTRLAKTHGGVT